MDTPTTTSQHAERQYLHTLIAGALLPLTQATSTALVVAIGTWIISAFVFDLVDAYKPPILLFAVTWVYMLIKLQRHWLSLTTIEQIFQKDFDGDGIIGEAIDPGPVTREPRRVVIQLDTVKEDGHYQVGDVSALIRLSCSDEQMHTLAQGLLNGMPFSEKTWSPTKDGKPFAVNEFRDLRAEMLQHKLIEYVSDKDPRQGMRLTTAGTAVMKEYAAFPTPL